jgi:hypothetical protein
MGLSIQNTRVKCAFKSWPAIQLAGREKTTNLRMLEASDLA